jgi:hypothetical protein
MQALSVPSDDLFPGDGLGIATSVQAKAKTLAQAQIKAPVQHPSAGARK